MERIYYKDVAVILAEMHYYLNGLHKLEQESYLWDLKYSRNARELYQTGLFHDAIGKVVNVTEDYVEIVTEY